MKQLIECVPNFSEGQDMTVIKAITDQVESVEGVQLLEVDPGYAANRTVVTFAGTPEAVIEAAFLAMKIAKECIDMRKQTGVHPRFGATDVCPLVPLQNISLEEVTVYAHQLAKRVGEELDYPVYCYEAAALVPERKNLAYVRTGEYEGLAEKMQYEVPDFGPEEFRPKTGATAIGARNFLIAYNLNLNTTSTKLANSIAFDLRESGRVKKDKKTGEALRDGQGNALRTAGALKAVKAIGWYIEEYKIAQVSTNLVDIDITPVHIAFDKACELATKRGLKVTGSELVGLLPLKVLIEAGIYFLAKEGKASDDEKELVAIAVKALGLDDLRPFETEKKVIEYVLHQQK